ncbi:hypothetical protein L226DRAFT_538667 [Lentinus tigrinus ALCF2SS1-7]|uniref:uncharacterized protein n=1 Tax=Lentinus tigrinus ALCF2SS1-7 TaxID=1328758 RepID=UPI001166196C|nr:hypothetical protein L226DRAFT_538667 [Lentinus tigrinus ALCF2SS1-7]
MAVLPMTCWSRVESRALCGSPLLNLPLFRKLGGVSMKPRPLATEAFGVGVVVFVRRMGIALLASSARLVIVS